MYYAVSSYWHILGHLTAFDDLLAAIWQLLRIALGLQPRYTRRRRRTSVRPPSLSPYAYPPPHLYPLPIPHTRSRCCLLPHSRVSPRPHKEPCTVIARFMRLTRRIRIVSAWPRGYLPSQTIAACCGAVAFPRPTYSGILRPARFVPPQGARLLRQFAACLLSRTRFAGAGCGMLSRLLSRSNRLLLLVSCGGWGIVVSVFATERICHS